VVRMKRCQTEGTYKMGASSRPKQGEKKMIWRLSGGRIEATRETTGEWWKLKNRGKNLGLWRHQGGSTWNDRKWHVERVEGVGGEYTNGGQTRGYETSGKVEKKAK